MDLSAPGSPVEDLVFRFDAEGSQRTPLPYEQSAAAAFEAIRQLDAILEPTSDAEVMVSAQGGEWRRPARVCGSALHAAPGIGPGGAADASSIAQRSCSTARSAAAAGLACRRCRLLAPPSATSQPPLPQPSLASQLARHVELACGGAHRVDPAALASVLQRLGYSAKLHESVRPPLPGAATPAP